LKDVSWVGFYFFDPDVDKLVLGPFQGKPACVEIGRGKGVCGHAYETGTTVVVPDVHEFPGHIACDADSRSEIVVPIKIRGAVAALLDVDSTTPARFSEQDAAGLEKAARVIELYSEDHYPFVFIKTI
jgi:GAF domain-containing protein